MRPITYLALGTALMAAPLMAQAPAGQTAPAATAAPASTPAAATPGQPNVVAGAAVSDASGGAVGTIESVADGVATLSTGTTKAGIPVGSFAQGPNGLVLGMTKAQVDAQASAAQTAQAAAAVPAGPPKFAVGAKVSDAKGAAVGTVKAVSDDTVTVASATASAQLSKTAFAQGSDGLVIGLSPEQFEAAAKAAGGKKG